MDAARFVLALLGAADALKNPNTTLLGSWPMIHAHDAATTYLSTGSSRRTDFYCSLKLTN